MMLVALASDHERSLVRRLSVLGLLGVVCALLLGCGAEAKFDEPTDDEHQEPLTNAVVGTPTGVVHIASDGRSTSAVACKAGGAGTSDETVRGERSALGGGVPGTGQWHFDDCSPKSRTLLDSSGLGANAQQALRAACVPGINGLGVQLRSAKDVIEIADEPQFSVGQHLGVAAWVNPQNVSGDQPIVVKRSKNKTAFSLGIHDGNVELAVVLQDGTTAVARAPIAAQKWTHVAGLFDGTALSLFVDGQQLAQVDAGGTVRDVRAPIRIGATTQTQFFDGSIDEVFLTTQQVTPDVLTALSCFVHPSTLEVSPKSNQPVPADVDVHYDLSLTNNDVGACSAKEFFIDDNNLGPGILLSFDKPVGQFALVLPGNRVQFGVQVSATGLADPGPRSVSLLVDAFGGASFQLQEQLNAPLLFELGESTGCSVKTLRELMITNTSVVDDPVRTAGSSDGTGSSSGSGVTAGVWSFGHLMREMAPTPEAAPAMTLNLLQHWLSDQTVNGFTVAARPAMQQQLIDIWPKTANGELDLDQSPLTLQAIVNRLDIRNLAEGSAGEGRLVYAVNGPAFGHFTLILEYNLVGHTAQAVTDWANRWHALGSLPFPSEAYNAALEAITRGFTDRNASPGSVNGSALVELRTNEIALSTNGLWEFRAFALSPGTGQLDEVTVKETPNSVFNFTDTFSSFVNQNASAIVASIPGGNAHTVPALFNDAPFLGGSVFNNGRGEWNGPNIADTEARFHASLNTCNGCHSEQTNSIFLMVSPRSPGNEAGLSSFLVGTTVFDRVTFQTRKLDDLGRRQADLMSLVCTTPTALAK